MRPREAKHENTVSFAMDDGRGRRLPELDGWRAVSVLLVMLYHILGYQHHRLLSRFSFLDLRVTYLGTLGVKIFFVISGFVICRLLISEELRCGSVSFKAFYYRRIFRILPPFYIYLAALSLLLCLGLIRESPRAILGSALFLFDIKITPHSWFVGHTWSLAVPCAAWNLSMVYSGWDALTSGNTRAGFACKSCGVLMAIHEARVRSIANGIPAFIVAVVALTLLVHPVGSYSWRAALYESLLVPPAIGLVLLFSLGRRGWLRVFLCSKPVQAVGLTSYGIYLWQQPFTAPKTYFSGTVEKTYFSDASQIIPLLLPLLCLIVPLSYFLIEKPAMRYGKFLSRRSRQGSISAERPLEESLLTL